MGRKGRSFLLLSVLLCLLLSAGCAARRETALIPPLHTGEEGRENSIESAVDVYDPLEGMNRRIYVFNYYFDKFIFLPVVNVYQALTPDYVQDRVSCFVDNVLEFNNFTNNLLQLKFKATAITVARFLVNSTIGIVGLWDRAEGMGMYRQPEDFGQTLGHYGVGDGPYIMLPLFGPSNLRDTAGLVTDTLAFGMYGPDEWVGDEDATLIFDLVMAVDKRRRQSFRYYQTGSPFEYEMLRMLYAAKREIEIAK